MPNGWQFQKHSIGSLAVAQVRRGWKKGGVGWFGREYIRKKCSNVSFIDYQYNFQMIFFRLRFLFVLFLPLLVSNQVLSSTSSCLGNCATCDPHLLTKCMLSEPCDSNFYLQKPDGICTLAPSTQLVSQQLLHSSIKGFQGLSRGWSTSKKQSYCEYVSPQGKKYFQIVGLYSDVEVLERTFQVDPLSDSFELTFDLLLDEWLPFNDFLVIEIMSQGDSLVNLEISFDERTTFDPRMAVITCNGMRVITKKYSLKFANPANNNRTRNQFTAVFTGFLFNAVWGLTNVRLHQGCLAYTLFNPKSQKCNKCDADSFLVSKHTADWCQKCPILCKTCYSATKCLTCVQGASLNKSGLCEFGDKFKTQVVPLTDQLASCDGQLKLGSSSSKITLTAVKNDDQLPYDEVQVGFMLYYLPNSWKPNSKGYISVKVNRVEVMRLDYRNLTNAGVIRCLAFKNNRTAKIEIFSDKIVHSDSAVLIEFELVGTDKSIQFGVGSVRVKSLIKYKPIPVVAQVQPKPVAVQPIPGNKATANSTPSSTPSNSTPSNTTPSNSTPVNPATANSIFGNLFPTTPTANSTSANSNPANLTPVSSSSVAPTPANQTTVNTPVESPVTASPTAPNSTLTNQAPIIPTTTNSTPANQSAVNPNPANSTPANSTTANSTAVNSSPANSTAANSSSANSNPINPSAATSTPVDSPLVDLTATDQNASKSASGIAPKPLFDSILWLALKNGTATNTPSPLANRADQSGKDTLSQPKIQSQPQTIITSPLILSPLTTVQTLPTNTPVPANTTSDSTTITPSATITPSSTISPSSADSQQPAQALYSNQSTNYSQKLEGKYLADLITKAEQSQNISFISSKNDSQSGLQIYIAGHLPLFDLVDYKAYIDKLDPADYSLTSAIIEDGKLKLFIRIDQSFLNGNIAIYSLATSRLLTESAPQLIGAFRVARFDSLSQSEINSMQGFTYVFRIAAWMAVISVCLATLLGYAVTVEQLVVSLQLLFMHAYIGSEYLPLSFRDVVGGLNIVQNLNFFLPAHRLAFQSWLGDSSKDLPVRFYLHSQGMHFLRQFYPIIVFNLICLVWFGCVLCLRKRLNRGLQDEDKGVPHRIIDNIANRGINFFDQIWRYQFLCTIWFCLIQFYDISSPINSAVFNGLLCVLAFLCSLAWPIFVNLHCRRQYYSCEYSEYLYFYEDAYYGKIPQYELPSGHHRLGHPVFRAVKLFYMALIVVCLGGRPTLALLALITAQVAELFYTKYYEIYLDKKYWILRAIENGLFIVVQLMMGVMLVCDQVAGSGVYKGMGYCLSGLALLVVVNGWVRMGYLGSRKIRQLLINQYGLTNEEKKPQTQRVV